jgi:hypothetical protein
MCHIEANRLRFVVIPRYHSHQMISVLILLTFRPIL